MLTFELFFALKFSPCMKAASPNKSVYVAIRNCYTNNLFCFHEKSTIYINTNTGKLNEAKDFSKTFT